MYLQYAFILKLMYVHITHFYLWWPWPLTTTKWCYIIYYSLIVGLHFKFYLIKMEKTLANTTHLNNSVPVTVFPFLRYPCLSISIYLFLLLCWWYVCMCVSAIEKQKNTFWNVNITWFVQCESEKFGTMMNTKNTMVYHFVCATLIHWK